MILYTPATAVQAHSAITVSARQQEYRIAFTKEPRQTRHEGEPGLMRSKTLLSTIADNLGKTLALLEEIHSHGRSYLDARGVEKDVLTEKVARLKEKIQGLLAETPYGRSTFSMDERYTVPAGEHMDQNEIFHFNNALAGKLPLDALDITTPIDEWEGAYQTARSMLQREHMRLSAFIMRLTYLSLYKDIRKKPCGSLSSINDVLFTASPVSLTKHLVARVDDYLGLTLTVLTAIREHAEVRYAELDEGKGITQSVYTIAVLIDEVNRIASHASFNRMSLLTGRFAPDADEFMPRLSAPLGEDLTTHVSLYVGTMTGYAFFPKTYDVLTRERHEYILQTKEAGERFEREIHAAIQKVVSNRIALAESVAKLPQNETSFSRPLTTLIEECYRKRIISIAKSKRRTLVYTGDPKEGVNARTLLVLDVAGRANKRIADTLSRMKEIAVVASGSGPSAEERRDMQERLLGLARKIESIAVGARVNGTALLTGQYEERVGGTHSLFHDRVVLTGITKDATLTLTFMAANRRALGLQEDSLLSVMREEEANRLLGVLDCAMQRVFFNTAFIQFSQRCVELSEIFLEHTRVFDECRFLEKQRRRNALDYSIGTILTLLRELLAEMKAITWSAHFPAYTYQDRFLMQSFIKDLAATYKSITDVMLEKVDVLTEDSLYPDESVEILAESTGEIYDEFLAPFEKADDTYTLSILHPERRSVVYRHLASAIATVKEGQRELGFDETFSVTRYSPIRPPITAIVITDEHKDALRLKEIVTGVDRIEALFNDILAIVGQVAQSNVGDEERKRAADEIAFLQKESDTIQQKTRYRFSRPLKGNKVKFPLPGRRQLLLEFRPMRLPVKVQIESMEAAGSTKDALESYCDIIIHNKELAYAYTTLYKAHYFFHGRREERIAEVYLNGTAYMLSNLLRECRRYILFSGSSIYNDINRMTYAEIVRLYITEIAYFLEHAECEGQRVFSGEYKTKFGTVPSLTTEKLGLTPLTNKSALLDAVMARNMLSLVNDAIDRVNSLVRVE